MFTHYNYTWKNTTGRYKASPLKYFEPDNLGDIVRIVKEAERRNVQLRTVGAGYSQNDLAVSEGFLVNLNRMDSLLKLRYNYLNAKAQTKNLVHVQAGMTMQKLNELMDSRGLCLPVIGGNEQQTLAGAIGTAAHGSGIEVPAMQGMVRSLLLVTHGGEVVRIEPSEGMVSSGEYKVSGVRLIQDDEYFYSVLVHLGCFGVVYSYILELSPMFYLEETKELTKWSKVRAMLSDGSLLNERYNGLQPYRALSLQINPYPDESGDHTCVINRQRELHSRPHISFENRSKHFFNTFLEGLPTGYWAGQTVMKLFPSRIPALIEATLNKMNGQVYADKAYKVMGQGSEWTSSHIQGSEFAFDMSGIPHYTAVVEKLFKEAGRLAREKNIYQPAPITLRFVKRSDAYLAPEFGKEVCCIDVPVLLNVHGADELLQHFERLMLAEGGIPHWGKVNDILAQYPERLVQLYPKLEIWERVFREMNPEGLFSNAFIERLNLGSLTTADASTLRRAA